jgi:hypothetical protein
LSFLIVECWLFARTVSVVIRKWEKCEKTTTVNTHTQLCLIKI